jgi:hypothetical protein
MVFAWTQRKVVVVKFEVPVKNAVELQDLLSLTVSAVLQFDSTFYYHRTLHLLFESPTPSCHAEVD